MSSHYSVRFVQSRKEEKITLEEYLDVKRACHRWLMRNCPNYKRYQEDAPERLKMKNWRDEDEPLTTNEKEKDKK